LERLTAFGVIPPYRGSAALVPSFRLQQEAERRRIAEGKVAGLESRIAELERVIKAGRLAEIKLVKRA
jgi:hypothetical protein